MACSAAGSPCAVLQRPAVLDARPDADCAAIAVAAVLASAAHAAADWLLGRVTATASDAAPGALVALIPAAVLFRVPSLGEPPLGWHADSAMIAPQRTVKVNVRMMTPVSHSGAAAPFSGALVWQRRGLYMRPDASRTKILLPTHSPSCLERLIRKGSPV